jgi:hypothetical protein
LNYLVGSSQQRFRDGEAERRGGLEVEDKFELGRPLDREVCRLLTLENAPGTDANLFVRIAQAAAVAHQGAGQGVLTVWEDRGQRMAGRQRREVFSVPVVEGTIADQDRTRRGCRLAIYCSDSWPR